MDKEKSPTATQIIENTVELVCNKLCKYSDTADENYECDYIREHGSCPLDALC